MVFECVFQVNKTGVMYYIVVGLLTTKVFDAPIHQELSYACSDFFCLEKSTSDIFSTCLVHFGSFYLALFIFSEHILIILLCYFYEK